MKILFLFIVTSLALMGCNNVIKPPKTISFTPANVVIDYTYNDLEAATSLAHQYCSSVNKDTQLIKTHEVCWPFLKKHAFFDCIESSNKMHHFNKGVGDSLSEPIIIKLR